MKKRGFTLIELVAVLAIISIVTAVGLMRFNIVDRLKANMELQTLINDVNHTKIKAISTGNSHKIVFDEKFYDIYGVIGTNYEMIDHREFEIISFTDYKTSNMKSEMIFNANGHVANAGSITVNVSGDTNEELLRTLTVRVGVGYAKIK